VAPAGEPPLAVQMNMVDGAYFETLGIPMLAGRTFRESDRVDAPRVALISTTAAREYWGADDPVGARIKLSVGWDDWAEVIGVVGDVIATSVHEPAPPLVYLPYAQQLYSTHYLVLRASGDPLQLAGPLRAAVRELDANLPLWDIQTMEERVAAVIQPTAFSAALLSLAATLALLLAAVGVFAVVAFSVASRTREFGVRMALGAQANNVVAQVVRGALNYTGSGLALGLLGSLLLTRVLQSQLHGVAPTDPLTFGLTTLLLLLVACAAAYLPARRATGIDPMEALRYE
jgi:putative ABC transport system permease protein